MKRVALLYYDGFAEFEIALTCLAFHQKYEILAVALEKREYRSEEQQRFCVDLAIREVDVDSIDLLVVPGGDPFPLIENQELKRFVETLAARNKKIGGICGGATLLAGLGLLKGKHCTGDTSGVDPKGDEYKYYAGAHLADKHVVVDGNIITAQGQAYAEFAVELAYQMGVVKNQDSCAEMLKWCKNIR
jgi:putative intracellular protease/amidase